MMMIAIAIICKSSVLSLPTEFVQVEGAAVAVRVGRLRRPTKHAASKTKQLGGEGSWTYYSEAPLPGIPLGIAGSPSSGTTASG